MIRRVWIGGGLALAAALAVAAPADAQFLHPLGPVVPGNTLVATGDDVWVRFVGHTAGFSDDLYQVALVGSSLTPQQFLFNNHSTPVGSQAMVTASFLPGQEVIFGIYVRNTGLWFYTGSPSRNPDGLNHVRFYAYTDTDGVDPVYQITVGFEDLYGGGDNDFDDLVFDFGGVTPGTPTVVPEPISMALLATGLLGVGGARLRRPRRQDALG